MLTSSIYDKRLVADYMCYVMRSPSIQSQLYHSHQLAMLPLFLLLVAVARVHAREIVFAPTYGQEQAILSRYNDPDISHAKFAGLDTFANLPYVHCLAEKSGDVEKFDIAILGAPFDTVSSDSLV